MKRFSFGFLLLTALYSLLPILLYGQVDTAWVRRYNGPGNGDDYAYAIAVDEQGNVYVTGYSVSSGTGDDYTTIKYNSAGVEQWVARYNGPGNWFDYAYAIAVDGSGNVYVTGESYGGLGTGPDYATIKYNSAGVEQWVRRYNGPGNDDDMASAVAVLGNNVYVTGWSWGSSTLYDYATIKYNSAGAQEWVARYHGPGNDYDWANAIAFGGSGNVYVTGGSYGFGTGPDYATIKYNSAGFEQWVARYHWPTNGGDTAYAIAVDALDNVYVTGWSGGDYATIKYNSAGVEQWVRRYNGPGNSGDRAYAIAVDFYVGKVYVTGYSVGSGTGRDYATIRYSSAGAQEWIARYNGPGNSDDWANAIAVDGEGNVYVTGFSSDSGTGVDYATIKYNSSGVEQWVRRYHGPGNGDDKARSIAVDGSGNVYVTGWSWDSGTGYDYATIKYVPTVAIEEEYRHPLSANREPLKIVPNPASSCFAIRLPRFIRTGNSFPLEVKIYNVAGKLVRVEKFKHSKTEEPKISLKGIKPGVYILKIKTEDKEFIQKIIVK